MTKFIAVVPGLRDPKSPNFDKPHETYELIEKIAAEFGINAYLLPYQHETDTELPLFSEMGRRVANGSPARPGLRDLQAKYQSGGILIGSSVGAVAAAEAQRYTRIPSAVFISYGGLLGVQKKLFEMYGAEDAFPQMVKTLRGETTLKVPVFAEPGQSNGYVEVTRQHLLDEESVCVQAMDQGLYYKLRSDKDLGTAIPDVLHRRSNEQARIFAAVLNEKRVIIMAGVNDQYCHPADIEDFEISMGDSGYQRRQPIEVVAMAGGHGWHEDRPDHLRRVIKAAITSKPIRPAAKGPITASLAS